MGAAGGTGSKGVVVTTFKAGAITWIIPPDISRRISHPSAGAVTQTVVVALVVDRIAWWRLLRRTLRWLLWHALIGVGAKLPLTADHLAVTLIVTVTVSHLGIAIKARRITLVVLALALLRIRLPILLPPLKCHAVDLRPLIPHVLAVWICIRISPVRTVRVNTLSEEQRQDQQEMMRGLHDGVFEIVKDTPPSGKTAISDATSSCCVHTKFAIFLDVIQFTAGGVKSVL